jgi:hypothetical protein
MDDDDFLKAWEENDIIDMTIPQNQLEEQTPKYQIDDGVAKYKLLANIVMYYYFAKYGKKMISNYFDYESTQAHCNLNFNLNKK